MKRMKGNGIEESMYSTKVQDKRPRGRLRRKWEKDIKKVLKKQKFHRRKRKMED